MEELEKQEQALKIELAQQKAKMDQMERENKRLALEDQKREKAQLLRKKRQEAAGSSGEFIDKLKKDLEKVNAQLDSALSQEKARQLKMMQEALQQKLAEAEKLQREEEERARAEAEAQRREKEEAERLKREQEERIDFLRYQILDKQCTLDKKRYMGGKIEQRTEYYTLLMRKKENQMATRMQQKVGASKFNSAGAGRVETGFELEATPAVSKEQQYKLLTDILNKIETLETKVRIQLNRQRQAINNGQAVIADKQSQYLETSSAHRSNNSFVTNSRKGHY